MGNKPLPCNRCGVKPKIPGGGRRYCQECQDHRTATLNDRSKAVLRTGQRKPRGVAVPDGTKWCPRCAKFLLVKNFLRSGRASYCKDCQAGVYYSTHIVRSYGINIDQYYEILAIQGGGCAICLRVLKKKRYAVDHNHKTGEVRGLLCSACNFRMIAAAKDDPEVLRRAALYLEEPPARKVLMDGSSSLSDRPDP